MQSVGFLGPRHNICATVLVFLIQDSTVSQIVIAVLVHRDRCRVSLLRRHCMTRDVAFQLLNYFLTTPYLLGMHRSPQYAPLFGQLIITPLTGAWLTGVLTRYRAHFHQEDPIQRWSFRYQGPP